MRIMPWYLQAPTGLEYHENQWRTGSKGTRFDKVAERVVYIKKNGPLFHFLLIPSFSNLHIYGSKKRTGECSG